jgi:acetoin utilization deacetylase AcuC-like enzyme
MMRNKILASIWSYAFCSDVTVIASNLKPLIITSSKFLNHRNHNIHPECPDRISRTHLVLKDMETSGSIRIMEPSACENESNLLHAENIIKSVHKNEYVTEIKTLCSKGARIASPWDLDTYISKGSFHTCLLAQSAWIDGVKEVLNNKCMAFAITRPPGHHALYDMGVERVGILDFDVHYGNGIADLIKNNSQIRYNKK